MEKFLLNNSNEFFAPRVFFSNSCETESIVEFFIANIRNRNTRRAYALAVTDFSHWCSSHQIRSIREVKTVHVATYIEGLPLAAPTIKLRLAALRMLFDWLVRAQVITSNPASGVRGPKHSAKKGKTCVLTAEEARSLINSIDISRVTGLRDRALISLMTYTFARVGAAIAMQIEDVYIQGRRTWVRLHEKGGKIHEMPCNHKLDEYLHLYINGAKLNGSGFLFRSAISRSNQLSDRPLSQTDVYRMIRRRATNAGIQTKIGAHSFRATGITEYLRNGGKLEIAQQMANHESSRTTSLYDRRNDDISITEVERILI